MVSTLGKEKQMGQISPKERGIGAVMGALIGDALGVGPHWYYDLDQLKKDYGDWIDDYHPPKPDRYHAGLKAGENSQTGQVTGMLLESTAEAGGYDEADFTRRLDELLDTLDGTPKGGRYTDAAMRDVWRSRQNGLDWSEAGSLADTAEAAIRTPILAARYYRDFGHTVEVLRDNVRLTHQDPFIAGRSVAFGLIVGSLINEKPLASASKYIGMWSRKYEVTLEVPLDCPGRQGPTSASFYDGLLQPMWASEAAGDPAVKIDPPKWPAACSAWPVPWISCCPPPIISRPGLKTISKWRFCRPSTAEATTWPGPR
jgi:hypothetical protein